jgi:hypothetical protein
MRCELVWLVGYLAALLSAAAIVVTGAYLLRRVVEDLSNSLEWKSFLLRIFRIAPGAILVVWGLVLVTRLINLISNLPSPTK